MVKFFKKTAINSDSSLKARFPDTYFNNENLLHLRGGTHMEKAVVNCTAAEQPTYGGGELTGFRFGFYVDSIDDTTGAAAPNVVSYKIKPQSGFTGTGKLSFNADNLLVVSGNNYSQYSTLNETFNGTTNYADEAPYNYKQEVVGGVHYKMIDPWIYPEDALKYIYFEDFPAEGGQKFYTMNKTVVPASGWFEGAKIDLGEYQRASDVRKRWGSDEESITGRKIIPLTYIEGKGFKTTELSDDYKQFGPGYISGSSNAKVQYRKEVRSDPPTVLNQVNRYNSIFNVRPADHFYFTNGDNEKSLVAGASVVFDSSNSLSDGASAKMYTLWADSNEATTGGLATYDRGSGGSNNQEVMMWTDLVPAPTKGLSVADYTDTSHIANYRDFDLDQSLQPNHIDIVMKIDELEQASRVGDNYTFNSASFVICLSEFKPKASESFYDFVKKHYPGVNAGGGSASNPTSFGNSAYAKAFMGLAFANTFGSDDDGGAEGGKGLGIYPSESTNNGAWAMDTGNNRISTNTGGANTFNLMGEWVKLRIYIDYMNTGSVTYAFLNPSDDTQIDDTNLVDDIINKKNVAFTASMDGTGGVFDDIKLWDGDGAGTGSALDVDGVVNFGVNQSVYAIEGSATTGSTTLSSSTSISAVNTSDNEITLNAGVSGSDNDLKSFVVPKPARLLHNRVSYSTSSGAHIRADWEGKGNLTGVPAAYDDSEDDYTPAGEIKNSATTPYLSFWLINKGDTDHSTGSTVLIDSVSFNNFTNRTSNNTIDADNPEIKGLTIPASTQIPKSAAYGTALAKTKSSSYIGFGFPTAESAGYYNSISTSTLQAKYLHFSGYMTSNLANSWKIGETDGSDYSARNLLFNPNIHIGYSGSGLHLGQAFDFKALAPTTIGNCGKYQSAGDGSNGGTGFGLALGDSSGTGSGIGLDTFRGGAGASNLTVDGSDLDNSTTGTGRTFTTNSSANNIIRVGDYIMVPDGKVTTSTFNSNFNSSATNLTGITSTANFRHGDIIQINNEKLYVSSITSSTTMTVQRAFLGTSAATHDGSSSAITIFRLRDEQMLVTAVSGTTVTVTRGASDIDGNTPVAGAHADGSKIYIMYKNMVDKFRNKGFARMLWNDHASSNFVQREFHGFAAKIVRVVDATAGLIEVDKPQVYGLSDNRTEYIVYRYGLPYTTAYYKNNLKVQDKIDGENRLQLTWDGLAEDNSTNLLNEKHLNELYIAPSRYWMWMHLNNSSDINGTQAQGKRQTDYTNKTYNGVMSFQDFTESSVDYLGTGEQISDGSQNYGVTYNELVYNDAKSGGLYAPTINTWNHKVTADGTSVLDLADYGFGDVTEDEEKNNVVKGGFMGKVIPFSSKYNYLKMDEVADKGANPIKSAENFDMILHFEDTSISTNVDIQSTEGTNAPFLLTVFEDKLPSSINDFKVIPNKDDPFNPEFNWTTNENDLWYGLLHIDTKTIGSQYHNAVIHYPLNEEGIEGAAATTGVTEKISGVTTAVSGPVYDIQGLAGFALNFDGNDDYVECNTGAGSDPTAACTTEMTVVAHIVPDAAGDERFIINQNPSNANAKFHIKLDSSDQLEAKVFFDTSGNGVVLTSGALTNDGETPTVVILTVDTTLSTGNVKLFVDGGLVDQSAASSTNGGTDSWKSGATINGGNSALYIGNSSSSGSNGFDGKIEEVVIYKKVLYPVVPNSNKFVLTKPYSELSSTATANSLSRTARLFVKDYHNIRGRAPSEVRGTNQISWRKAAFKLDYT